MRRSRKFGLALVMALTVAALAVGVVLARGLGGGVGGIHAGTASPVQILSDLSGVLVDDLHAARLEGNSLLDIAEANGVAGDDLTAAVVVARTAAVDALVADGTITAEQADLMNARMTERLEVMLARTAVGPSARGHAERGAGGGAFGRHGGTGSHAGAVRGECDPKGAGPFGPRAQA